MSWKSIAITVVLGAILFPEQAVTLVRAACFVGFIGVAFGALLDAPTLRNKAAALAAGCFVGAFAAGAAESLGRQLLGVALAHPATPWVVAATSVTVGVLGAARLRAALLAAPQQERRRLLVRRRAQVHPIEPQSRMQIDAPGVAAADDEIGLFSERGR